jgi:hypothetical protein
MTFAEQNQECPYCGEPSRTRTRRSSISTPEWAKVGTAPKQSAAKPTEIEDAGWRPANYEAVDYRRTFLLLLLLVVSALAYMMYDLVNEGHDGGHARMEWCTQYCVDELNRGRARGTLKEESGFVGRCRSECMRNHGAR